MKSISLYDIFVTINDPREQELPVPTPGYGQGPSPVVSLTGQAGIADTGWIRMLLERQAAQGEGRLIVDLSRLSSMDWWVALILTWASQVVSRRGGRLILANPRPAVARMLDAVAAPDVVTTPDGI